MSSRRRRITYLTAVVVAAAIIFTVWWRRPDGEEQAARAAQRRAFAAALHNSPAAGVRAAAGPNQSGQSPALSPEEKSRTEEAPKLFMQTAPRNTDEAKRHIAGLRALHGLLQHRYSEGSGRVRRLKEAGLQLETATMNTATLTPGARQKWDEGLATGWKGYPLEEPEAAFEIFGHEVIKAWEFGKRRTALTEPLVEEFERLDDRQEELSRVPRNVPAAYDDLTAELQAVQAERDRARAQLIETLLETEELQRQWMARGWQGAPLPETGGSGRP